MARLSVWSGAGGVMVARLPMRWRKPMAQARAIAARKTPLGRAPAIHVWTLMVMEALRGDVPVRDVQHEPRANLDTGARTEVRGANGVAPARSDGERVPDRGGSQARLELEEAA